MPMSISRSLSLCSAFACMLFLSACSENDAADVSFEDNIDRSNIPTNIVSNNDLSGSSTEWTGWDATLDDSNGAGALFTLESFVDSQGGNTLKVGVGNIAPNTVPEEIQVGPVSVPVEAGKSYGVGAFALGPRCGLAKFVVHATDDPSNVLAEKEFFLNGLLQSFDFYFDVPDSGVASVNMPVQLGYADNIGGDIYVDRITAIPTTPPPPGEEGNVAINSDFEDNDSTIDAEGSDTWSNSGSAATFSLDTEVAQSGSNSVRIEFNDVDTGVGNPWDIEGGPVNVPVQDGWTYILSAWIRGDEGARANFLVQNPTAYNVFNESAVTVTDEWQEVRFEARITGTNVVRLYTQYNFPENAGKTIYVDNFKLIPPDICPFLPVTSHLVSDNPDLFEYEHVTNGGLEESTTESPGWFTEVSGSGAAAFEVVTTGDTNKTLVNGGNNALKTTINTVGENAFDVQAGATDLYVEPGQTYVYSGYARGPAGTRAMFAATQGSDASTVIEELAVVFSNLWQQYTFEFTVPESAPVLTQEQLAALGMSEDAVVTQIRLTVGMSYAENQGKPILLDDFSLLPNAVVNGDLESSNDEAIGWSVQAPEGTTITGAIDATEAHSGSNSYRVDIGTVAEGANVYDIHAGVGSIPVAGGRSYFVSTRVKGDADAKAKILVDLAQSPFDEYGSVAEVEISDEWQEVTFEAVIPDGVESVRLLAQLGFEENSGKTVYFDSFKLVSQIPPEEAANTANIVTNSGLENGNTVGWNGNNATLNVTTSSEGVYSGNFGLHVTERTSSWNSAQYSLLEAGLVDGGRYQVSSMVKVDGDAADNLKLTLLVRYADGSDDQYIGISATGEADTLSWTNLGGAFDFNPASEVSGVWVYIESDGAETSYFIDDLFITQEYSTNGNLELGDTTGWNAAGASIAVSDIEPFDGTYSLHVTGRTETWNSAQYELINTGVQAGRTYQISAWVKIDGDVADNIKMTVEVQDEDNDTNRYLGLDQSAETLDWVMLSRTYTFAPDGEATSFKVYFEADTATSSYFIDNLVITEVIPPVNITDNGGMELGRTDGWENSGDAVIAVTQSAEGVNSGIYGLEVTGRTQNWHSAQYVLTEAGLVEGATYMASAWVKAIGDTADNIKLTFYFNDGGDNYLGVGQTGEADTLGWTKIEGMFNYIPTSDVSRSHIYIEADGAETEYYVDDLIVKQMYSVNGGLEASDTEATGWNAAGATIAVTTDDANSGNNSLLVSERSAGWHSAQYNLLNSGMEPGKTYDISAWVKIVGDVADNIKMTVEVQDDDNDSNQYLTIAQSSETLTWVKLSSRYTYAPDGDATVFRVYFEADLEDSAYYIDDLVIKEADEVNPF